MRYVDITIYRYTELPRETNTPRVIITRYNTNYYKDKDLRINAVGL